MEAVGSEIGVYGVEVGRKLFAQTREYGGWAKKMVPMVSKLGINCLSTFRGDG